MSFFVLLPVCIKGQTSKDVLESSYLDLDYQRKLFDVHFGKLASKYNLWKGNTWSDIGLYFNNTNRDYKAPQMYGSENSLSLGTESVQRIDSMGYTFYGKFSYKTDRFFDSKFNQVHSFPEYGNPFYLFTPLTGKWETQEYYLEGGAAKSIVENKLSLGVHIIYGGSFFNKTNDTRNKQTNSSISISPSITYGIGAANHVSLAFIYSRDKYKPMNSNHYAIPGDDPDYWLYLNQGLGTYYRPSLGYGLVSLNNSYGMNTEWYIAFSDDKNLTLNISADLSEDINRSVISKPSSDDPYIYGKYKLLKYNASINYSNSIGNGRLISVLKYQGISGNGHTFNEEQLSYQKSYNFSSRVVSFSTDYYNQNLFARKLSLSVDYDYTYGIDLNYGQKYSYSNVIPRFSIVFPSHSIFKGRMSYILDFYSNLNLDYFHDPVGARENIYTKEILSPTIAYETSNYVSVSPSINYSIRLTNKMLANFNFGVGLFKPLSVNYENLNTSLSTDVYNSSVFTAFKIIF